MKFIIIWPDSAQEQLAKLDRPIAKRIYEAVGRLEYNPARWVSRIVNSEYYKLRVGDYRVILDIRANQLRVLVVRVGHRKNIYKNM